MYIIAQRTYVVFKIICLNRKIMESRLTSIQSLISLLHTMYEMAVASPKCLLLSHDTSIESQATDSFVMDIKQPSNETRTWAEHLIRR